MVHRPDARPIERSIARIVVPYAVFAALWIFLSDRALDRLIPDHETYAAYALLKGLAFVVVTAMLLWGLLRMEFARRRHAEEALAGATRQLQRAQQIAQVGHWVWYIASNRLEWSDEMYRIFGIDREGFHGDLADAATLAIHPDDRSEVARLTGRLLEGEKFRPIEYRIARPDGSVRTVWSEVADLAIGANGKPISASGIVQDITVRKELEQHMLRVQRAEAVAAMASGMAHDLNNILTPVTMIAPMLRPGLTSDEGMAMLDTLEDCARRGGDLVQQLLTVARGEPGSRDPVALVEVMTEIADLARETFPKAILVDLRVDDDVSDVVGDATQIHRVLLNLCLNARDAMPGGGRLTLAAGNVALDAAAVGPPEGAPGLHVRVRVADTGIGIAREHMTRIFDPFFTTKPKGKGTGLGLSSALGVVRGHGGFVRVQSTPGHGSTFDIYLPAAGHGPPRDDEQSTEARA